MTAQKFAALFDMDGVLIDSVIYHWQAMNEVLADYGLNVPDKDLRKYVGQPLYRQVKQLSDVFGVVLDYDEFNQRTTARKLELLEHIEPKEGVLTLLELLKSNGIPMAVATSNTRTETDRRLEAVGIRSYFSAVITEDDVSEHKPEPAVYIAAAEAVKTLPNSCVVFEDAPAGIESARRAGMKSIAVRTPYTTTEDLGNANALVSSLADVSIELMTGLLK